MDTMVNVTMPESLWSKVDRMSDRRTRGLPLVDSYMDVIVVVLAYLLMVFIGPRLMERRKPFEIRGVMIVYNFLLTLTSSIVLIDLVVGSYRLGYHYLCTQVGIGGHPEESRLVTAMYIFYLSKVIEAADTLFFILRKKNNQLSALHIYHHSTVIPFSWMTVKWCPSGNFASLAILNSFVHVVMYAYYGLSAIGPSVQKYLWWKKYLTQLQMTQFACSMIWSIHLLGAGCNHHITFDTLNIMYMVSFLILFGKFYLSSYNSKKVKV